jgi:chromosomal replication initiator protein
MYIMREDLKSSYPFIGRRFGNKDHTTAIHSYGKIAKEMQSGGNLSEEIEMIRQRVTSV